MATGFYDFAHDDEIIELLPLEDESTGDLWQGPAPEETPEEPPLAASPDDRPDAGSSSAAKSSMTPVLRIAPLLYPFRGTALVALLLLIAFPVATTFFGIFGIGVFFLAALFASAVTAMVIFEIIRQTAAGGDTLRGTPDPLDLAPRSMELLATYVLGLIPMILATGATFLLMEAAKGIAGDFGSALVSPLIFAIDLLCLGLWLMALGATAIYDDWSFAVRADLHLKAVWKCKTAGLAFIVRNVVVLAVMGLTIAVAGPFKPLLMLASPFYLILANAHFVGLLFRENESTLTAIYLAE